MADDLLGTGQARACGRVVEALDEPGRAGESCPRERNLVGVMRHLAGDEAEDLTPLLVDPEQPWRACETNVLEVPQQRVNVRRVGMKVPPHGFAHPHHGRSASATAERGLAFSAHRHAAIPVPPLPRVHCHTARDTRAASA